MVVNAIVMLIEVTQHPQLSTLIKVQLFASGLSFMLEAFAFYGALELSKLLVGRAALGAKLAAFGWLVSAALAIIEIGIRFSSDSDWVQSLSLYFSWAWFVAKLCIIGG